MHVTPFMIYVIGQLNIWNNLLTFFGTIGLITSIGVIVLLVLTKCDLEEEMMKPDFLVNKPSLANQIKIIEEFLKPSKFVLISAIISIIVVILTPSSQTLATMYILPPILNNQHVQSIPNNLVKYADEFLKDKINQLTKDKAK